MRQIIIHYKYITYICQINIKKIHRTHVDHKYIQIIDQIFVIDKYKINTVRILVIDRYIKKHTIFF